MTSVHTETARETVARESRPDESEERIAPKRQDSGGGPNAMSKVAETWGNMTRFLTDVRAETRKVTTPSWKEVRATTTVVIVAVFIFL